jgi:hypothetical protein
LKSQKLLRSSRREESRLPKTKIYLVYFQLKSIDVFGVVIQSNPLEKIKVKSGQEKTRKTIILAD